MASCRQRISLHNIRMAVESAWRWPSSVAAGQHSYRLSSGLTGRMGRESCRVPAPRSASPDRWTPASWVPGTRALRSADRWSPSVSARHLLVGLHFFGIPRSESAGLAQAVELPVVLPPAHRLFGRPVGRQLILPTDATSVGIAAGLLPIALVLGYTWVGLLIGARPRTLGYALILVIFRLDSLMLTLATVGRVLEQPGNGMAAPTPAKRE